MVAGFTSKEFERATVLRAPDWQRDTRTYFIISLIIGIVLLPIALLGASVKLLSFGLIIPAFGTLNFYSHKFRLMYSGGSPWDRLVDDWHALRSQCENNFNCDIGDNPNTVIFWGTMRSRFLLVAFPIESDEYAGHDTNGYLVAHYCDFRKRMDKLPHWIFLRHKYFGEEHDLVCYFRQINCEIENVLLGSSKSQHIEKAPDPIRHEPLRSLLYQKGIGVDIIDLSSQQAEGAGGS